MQRVVVDPNVKKVGALFRSAGFQLYAVGGQVRNRLLNLPIGDLDICSSANPEEVVKILENSDIRVVPIAPEFGSLRLILEDNGKSLVMEYTTLRRDYYGHDGRHRPKGVYFSKSIEEDAFRRDFTVNAIYAEAVSGEIFDPSGGVEDLKNGLLRCTSSDPDIILRDDGLRTMRLLRFAAELDFDIEDKTLESARKHAYLLADIAVERIWQEFQKILMSDIRYKKDYRKELIMDADELTLDDVQNLAHCKAIKLLKELNMLNYILPELMEGYCIKQSEKYHEYDVLTHNIMACAWSVPNLNVRLASLLHDVAKPRQLRDTGMMLGHDELGAEMVVTMLRRLRVENNTVSRVATLVKHHMFNLNNNAKKATLCKKIVRLGVDAARELSFVREADFLGSGKNTAPVMSALRFQETLNTMIKKNTAFSIQDIAITGEEIMEITGFEPSAKIKHIKEALWMHCAAHPGDNRSDRLKIMIKNIVSNPGFNKLD